MNQNDRDRIKALFPRASESFLSLNLGFGLPAKKSKPDSGAALVGKAQGETKSDARIGVSIVMYRVRELDKDNAYASAKPLLDCLQSCNLIPNDSEKVIDLQVTQEKVSHRKDQKTTLKITYP